MTRVVVKDADYACFTAEVSAETPYGTISKLLARVQIAANPRVYKSTRVERF